MSALALNPCFESAEDVAEVIAWVASRPAHVNIDRLVVRPRAQAANHKVHRVG